MLNSDYKDILQSLSNRKVKFLLVGAFLHSQVIEIEGLPVHVLSIQDLIKNKRSTGRIKDLADAQALEKIGD